ncbi:MAG: hypothetical protein JWM44_3592 [Bacilli bacterium]|nr:hypothetical protein [Bacilli bacterium]
MNPKILPIGSPPVFGYLCNAYPLSIVSTEDKYLDWFYSHYIQLTTHLPGKHFFTFYTPLYQWYEYMLQCPFLTYQKLETAIVDKYPNGILQFIMDRIDQDGYVQLYVNEYFLSGKRAYKSFHFPHEILLYGYNKAESKLNIVGFNERTMFGQYEIDFAEFLEAYDHCHRDELYEDHIPFKKYVYVFHYNRQYEYPFDLKLVIQSLKEYLSGHNSSNTFRALRPPTRAAAGRDVFSYGMDFYKLFTHYLQYNIGELNETMDLRLTHTNWEHKKVMLERIRYMGEKNILKQAESYYLAFEKVEQKALVARNACVKYRIKPNKQLLQSILDDYLQIEHGERQILQEMVVELEKVNESDENKGVVS